MKSFLFTAIALVLCLEAFCQSDYRNGFVITQNRDSISGLVNFRDGGKSHSSCDFKTSSSAEATTYTAKDLIAYGFIGDKRFESKTIKDGDKLEIVFMEVVVAGNLTLYQMRDRFWVQKKGGDLTELLNNTKDQYVDGQRVMRYDNMHIATLNMLMADCRIVTTSLENSRLEKRTLTKVVNDYNECVGGSSVVFQEKKPWAEVRFAVGGGVNFSSLNFKDAQGAAAAIAGTTKATAVMIGVTLDFISPRVSERLAVTVGAYYSPIAYVVESKFHPGSDYMKMDLDQLKVPVGLKYMFKGRRLVPYVNAGGSFSFNVNSKVTWYEPAQSSIIEFLQADFEVKPAEMGYWGGIGTNIPLNSRLGIQVEFRYEHTNGVVPASRAYLKSPVNNLQALVALRF
ncbi:porin family protein [Chryseolinea sp. T2]|uniref:porin family protein n=1 Tax=Chryseolinea sp. T2 TaxID=3129255 RepID=UPI003078659F